MNLHYVKPPYSNKTLTRLNPGPKKAFPMYDFYSQNEVKTNKQTHKTHTHNNLYSMTDWHLFWKPVDHRIPAGWKSISIFIMWPDRNVNENHINNICQFFYANMDKRSFFSWTQEKDGIGIVLLGLAQNSFFFLILPYDCNRTGAFFERVELNRSENPLLCHPVISNPLTPERENARCWSP